MEDIKQVIVIRKDLNMRKGKSVSQGCHASLNVFLNRMFISPRFDGSYTASLCLSEIEKKWIEGDYKKICVYVNSEKELEQLYVSAFEEKIPAFLAEDNGLTEFNGVKTKTALAIGPDLSEKIDKITGHLPLL